MRICIIGCSGYIGSKLSEMLSSVGHQVHGVDLVKPRVSTLSSFDNISDSDIEPSVLINMDIIIYLAGVSGRKGCDEIPWEAVYEKNVKNILDVIHKMNPDSLFVYASSAAVLEGGIFNPVSECYTVNEKKLDKYSLSMYRREQEIKKIKNINTIGLRFGTVIGISHSQRYDLLHIAMVISAINTGVISVKNGHCKRSILGMNDLLAVFKNIVASKGAIKGHNLYNVSSFNTTIMDTAVMISDKMSAKVVIDTVQCTEEPVGFLQDNGHFCTDFSFKFKDTNETITSLIIDNKYLLATGRELVSGIECRVCKSHNVINVLDLGSQPLANNYTDTPCTQETFPLCLVRCRQCNHTQLNYTVSPSKMFSNYQYNSGTSSTLREYFTMLATKCEADIKKKGIVLELACNDGTQLDEFLKLGWETYGVDPATNLCEIAIKKGHNIFNCFWGEDRINGLPQNIDVIVAQNVLAHVPDPTKFLKECERVMNDNTYLYIQTSQCNMLINGEFDTIYHEHLSYFTVSSLVKIAELCNLTIVELTKQPIHGTSFLCVLKRSGKNDLMSTTVNTLLSNEINTGLHGDGYYIDYKRKVSQIKTRIADLVGRISANGNKIIAYGAAAKGMTMMNYFDLSCIEYIIDDAEMKQGKYTPGTNKLIKSPLALLEETADSELYIIVFAWNFEREIIENILKYRKHNVSVILPFPELIVKKL